MTLRRSGAFFLFVAACVALLSSCVVAPVSRTYFEPNPEDGVLKPSSSCGYHRAAKDSLERKIDGITLSVLPRYEKDQPLRIYVYLSKTPQVLAVDPSKVELRVGTPATTFHPEKAEAKDSQGPSFSKSVFLNFPSATAQAEEFEIVFLPGFLTLDGVTTAHRPFRFRKTTKLDIYYSSINC